nr:Swt1 family HEPN domain-containing protein [Brevundimonas diminuta]
MAIVYTAVAAFENSVRNLVSTTLLEAKGASWWSECVSEKIRSAAEKRLEEEKRVRWHVQRGEDPIQFTMLPNLLNIIRQNQECFEPFIPDLDWAASIFDVIEKSRNVIMHSGQLSRRDVARLGTHLRDWSTQVTV